MRKLYPTAQYSLRTEGRRHSTKIQHNKLPGFGGGFASATWLKVGHICKGERLYGCRKERKQWFAALKRRRMHESKQTVRERRGREHGGLRRQGQSEAQPALEFSALVPDQQKEERKGSGRGRERREHARAQLPVWQPGQSPAGVG